MSSRGLATATVILFVALTPTWADGVQLWEDREGWKLPLVLWYLALVYIACEYWRILR